LPKSFAPSTKFNGYIHLKTIPGASEDLIREAGLYADRLSVNVEMPTEQSLKLIGSRQKAGRHDKANDLCEKRDHCQPGRKETRVKAPLFAPAGQSTQMVIGATPKTTGRF
jgi:predicted DNA-binding helix-hairpin-helix protein